MARIVPPATIGGAGDDILRSLSPVPSGGHIAAGETSSFGGGARDGWLVRLNAAGDVVWQHSYGAGSEQYFWKAVATDDGGFVATGRDYNKLYGNEDWLAKVDGDGRIQWYAAGGLGTATTAVAPAAGGFVFSSGTKLQRRDNAGAVIWTVDYAAKCSAINAVAVLPDQSIIAAGAGNPAGQPCFIHADAWGNTSCAAAGKCVDKTVPQCEDGDTCTDPGCDPAVGCKPVANKAPCQSSAACTALDACANGACVSSGKARLYDIASGTTGDDAYNAVAQSRLGGLVVAGVRTFFVPTTVNNGTVARVTETGEVVWKVYPADPIYKTMLSPSAVTELSDGRIAACGVGSCVILSPQGTQLVQGFNGSNHPASLLALPNDQLIVAGANSSGLGDIEAVTDQLKSLWSLQPPTTKSCGNLVLHNDGQVEAWCSGLNAAGKVNDMVRVMFSTAGKLVSSEHFATNGAISAWGRAIDASGNSYLATTTVGGGGKLNTVQLYKFNAKGEVLWQRLVGSPLDFHMASAVVATSAGVVIMGVAGNGCCNSKAWLAGIDTAGNLAWQQQVGDAAGFSSGVALDNNLIAVGYTSSKGAGASDEWLVRTDAWGKTPCPLSIPCAKTAPDACLDDQACTIDSCVAPYGCQHDPSTCDDGNPCTTDACDAKLGCQWTPQADGTPACPNSGKCSLGYCP